MRGPSVAAAACACVLVGALGCDFIGRRHASGDAGASHATSVATTPIASAKPDESGAARAKSLDASACNPGTSLEPIDKGKTVQTDHFKYTLLDVRTDVVDNAFAPVKKVFLVKLQVENVTSKPNLNLSVTDVDLTRDKAGAERIRESNLHYKVDFFYPRSKMCVDLGGDVKPGSIPPGTRVIGYYAFQAPDNPAPKSLWFDARHVSPESVSKGTLLRVAGTLRIK